MAQDFAIKTVFDAEGNINRVLKAMGSNSKRFGNTASSAFDKASKSGSRFRDVVKGILAADAIKAGLRGIKTGISAIIEEASNVENAVADFRTLTGSVEAAEETVNQLRSTAATTPFEFGNLAQASKTLLGFEAATRENLIPTLRMLGDTAGGQADRFQGIVLAFSQIQAGGKASMQDINQLINNGVPILGALAKQWKVTVGRAREMISTGKATGKEVSKAFKSMTSEGGKFFNGMNIASETFSGRMSTLRDNVKIAAASIGEALLPFVKELTDVFIEVAMKVNEWAQSNKELIKTKITEFVNGLKSAIKAAIAFTKRAVEIFKEWLPVLKAFAPIIPVIVAAFVAYNAVLKAMAIAKAIQGFFMLMNALRAAAAAQGVLNLIMTANPIGAVITAIAALVGAIILIIHNWDFLKKVFIEGYNVLKQGFLEWMKILKTGFSLAFEAIKAILFTFADIFLSTWGNIIKTILSGISSVAGVIGIDASAVDTAIQTIEKAQKIAKERSLLGGGTLEAPNSSSVQGNQNINFQGRLDISGAPAGSTVQSTTRGAPAIQTNMLGANP